jgi:drug/metabolite transporter (DMT)-like permease
LTDAASTSEAADRLRGIGLFCVTLICFTCLDTAAKYASRFVPISEIIWIRYLGHAVIVFLLLRPWRNLAAYRTRRPVAQVVRSLFLFGSTLFNFIALLTLQLDQTATIGFASAFVIAGLAGPLLGEWIGPRRWAAIAVGFVGVLLVLRPSGKGLDPTLLYSVASMLCYSAYNLMTRQLAATETPATLLLYSAVIPAAFLTPFALPGAISPPSVLVGVIIASTAIFGAVGHWILIHAYRRAPAALLAPFGYTQIIWMPASGYLVFGDVPKGNTLIGAAIIVASGLYILYRERVRSS